jgi:hypothetical protein
MQCVVLQPKLNFRVVQPKFIEKHFHHKKQSFTTNKELRTTCEHAVVLHIVVINMVGELMLVRLQEASPRYVFVRPPWRYKASCGSTRIDIDDNM